MVDAAISLLVVLAGYAILEFITFMLIDGTRSPFLGWINVALALGMGTVSYRRLRSG